MFGEKDRNEGSAKAEAALRDGVPPKGATLIAANTRIEGNVHFSDQLLVNGQIDGNVFADQDSDAGLTISAKGVVEGEVRVPNVVINGRVKGDIHASKHVELAAEARVEGNVYYHLIEMVMGARVDGSLVYTPAGEQGKAPGKGSSPASASPSTGSAGSAPADDKPVGSNPTAAVGKASG